jgi:hypothetical protein
MERKAITIPRHIIYMSVILFSCALTGLFASCEKELAGEGSGRKIAVNISLDSSESVDDMRSSVAQTPKSETAIIPLGNGRYINATLTEMPVDDPTSDELRAAANLVEGQKVRMAAFQNTTSTQESAADYIYSGGKLNPVSTPLMVEEDADYNIVAYSYYNETEDYPVIENISSEKQLLWGTSGQKYITATDAAVSFRMLQRFAQAKVSITTTHLSGTPNITAVSGVEIASGGNRCNLSVWNGLLSTGTSPVTQTVNFSTFGSHTVTSAPRMIYPVAAGQTTTVTVGSIAVDGFAPMTNLVAAFNQTFLGGRSYVLTLDLKETAFAGSNIYWDGSKMDFKPAGYVGPENFYQGLYFRWGSMVGMLATANAGVTPANPVYYPIDDNTWSTNGTILSFLYSDQTDILSMNTALAASHGSLGIANDYVTNGYAADNNGEAFNYTDQWGDICRRINPDYRLPRGEEFSVSAGNCPWGPASEALGWYRGTDATGGAITFQDLTPNGTNAQGTSVMDYDNFGAGFCTYQGIVKFPAAGVRHYVASAHMLSFGYDGCYWTSSVEYSSAAHALHFNSSSVWVSSANSGWGYSVRCVKN